MSIEEWTCRNLHVLTLFAYSFRVSTSSSLLKKETCRLVHPSFHSLPCTWTSKYGSCLVHRYCRNSLIFRCSPMSCDPPMRVLIERCVSELAISLRVRYLKSSVGVDFSPKSAIVKNAQTFSYMYAFERILLKLLHIGLNHNDCSWDVSLLCAELVSFSIGYKNQFVKNSYKLKSECAFPVARFAKSSGSQVALRIMFLECLRNSVSNPSWFFLYMIFSVPSSL